MPALWRAARDDVPTGDAAAAQPILALVAVSKITDADDDSSLRVAGVTLLDRRARGGSAHHLRIGQIEGITEGWIKGEEDIAPSDDIAGGASVSGKLGALEVAEVADVVRRAVVSHPKERRLFGPGEIEAFRE